MRKTALTLGGFLIATGAALAVSAPAQAAALSCGCGPVSPAYGPAGYGPAGYGPAGYGPAGYGRPLQGNVSNHGVQQAYVEQHGLINISLIDQTLNQSGGSNLLRRAPGSIYN
ncbi:hypothetical protein Aca07nite_78530 [Actinoplanes capillaceus]|uniref:Uncharacterized protein n=1 Tax=Actinoplanes campanulatus TaxID=113559 RepID=A0ABQ3WWA3_9ACTN|nr:hypothetical protein [Actinoplanes capillaceus]GID50578.1 hypothetical protein Aca07nite_78530 [Actinoplanes capillaceus]